MIKNTWAGFAILFMATLCCEGSILKVPNFKNQFLVSEDKDLVVSYENKEPLPWQTHVNDFINLIDVEKILSTAVRYIDDPEVMKFIGFLLSPKFKDMVWELELMEEFKEAYLFLASKGYDVKDAIDYVNSVLSLPEFNKPKEVLRNKGKVSEFIAEIIGTIPVQDMKDLLKSKIENYPEVARFVEVVRSPEFVDIIERMVTSKEFRGFKTTFESYGVDFDFICKIITEIIGDEYENKLCAHTNIELLY